MPTARTARTADECRRVGNDLYRAAQTLAQSHAADVEGVTFGAEGGGYHADGSGVGGWLMLGALR